jgi:hypothetical protein
LSGSLALRGLEVSDIIVFEDECNGFICFLHVKSSKFTVLPSEMQASPDEKLSKNAPKLTFFL